MHKTLNICILAIALCAITLSTYGTNINELNLRKEDLQSKIEENTQNLNYVEEELTENLKQLQKVDENIDEVEKGLNDVNEKIENIQNEISEIQKEVDKINKIYKYEKNLLDIRLSSMYESGTSTYLDVVAGSKSLQDFLSSYFLLSELVSYDIDLLEQVNEEKTKIEQKKNEIEKKKQDLEAKKEVARKTQIALSNTKLLRENYTSKLTEEEKAIEAQIEEYKNEFKKVEQEITAQSVILNFGEDYKGGTMKWPIANHYTVTSNYGMRVHPITGVYKLHTGVDISAEIGTDFTAIADGIVIKAEMNKAYGNMVVIDHGGGIQTLYAHGSSIEAEVGQVVKAGDVVLKVGSTGYSTGPHAHFEVRINGSTVNPLDYVKIDE